MEERKQHFWHIMLYYLKEAKNATEMQKKDLCSVWRRCCDWLNVSKVVYIASYGDYKIIYGDFFVDDAP